MVTGPAWEWEGKLECDGAFRALEDEIVARTLDDISVRPVEPGLASSSHHEMDFESSIDLGV